MIIDKYLKFEKEKDLFQLDINGFNYWPYVRKAVYDEILFQINTVGQAHTNLTEESRKHKLGLKIKQIPNWIFKNPLLGLKEKDVLVLNHQRRIKVNKHYDCVYTDQLLENSDFSYYTFEQPLLEKHFTPVKTENLRYFDFINFIVMVKKIIWKRVFRFGFKETQKNEIKDIINEINSEFNVKIDETHIVSQVENLYLFQKFSKKYYAKILDRVKPKVIVEVVSYGKDRILMNSLAKERKIPVIELQHGTMGKYHIAYNFHDNYKNTSFPDYMFTFGQFWKDVTHFPIPEENVPVVGWPYYEQKVNSYKSENLNEKHGIKTILFVSQGTIGKELSQLAVKLAEELDLSRFQIVYKLHPGEYDRWEKEYPWLLNKNIDIIDNSDHDMHYYFAKSSIQVGVYSTAIFEGLSYNLETYIVKLYGYQFMEELFESNLATLVSNVSDLVYNIDKSESTKKHMSVNYLWEKDSLNKMRVELGLIINKGFVSKNEK